jgi:tetraacyldisaccharide 4'-kinase
MRAPDFWRHDGFPARLLAPLGALLGAAGWWRRALARPIPAPVPVICVGNLVAGGAGKTPLALALFDHLTARGLVPHFLSRGYGGALSGPIRVDPDRHGWAEVGDEALLLAARGPTWVARDRVAGARAAAAGGADCIIMDDGFQNPSLAKSLSLLAVDGGYGFGNGKLLPAGPLRESVGSGLARAQAAILIGDDRHGLGRSLPGRLPLLKAKLATRDRETWKARRVIAFAGIGRPEKFFESLRRAGAAVLAERPFPDHHPYKPAELAALLDQARAFDAELVTTAKDRVRLPPETNESIAVLEVDLVWTDEDGPAQLDRLIDRAWART